MLDAAGFLQGFSEFDWVRALHTYLKIIHLRDLRTQIVGPVEEGEVLLVHLLQMLKNELLLFLESTTHSSHLREKVFVQVLFAPFLKISSFFLRSKLIACTNRTEAMFSDSK